MKALDTNILVRFLVQDDELQASKVDQLFASAEQRKETLFVPLLVVLELIWVLQSAYAVARKDIILAISALLQMPVLEFEKQPVLREFVGSAEGFRGDLADLLIAHSALASACETVLTCDKKAAGYRYFTLL
ncbi:MAG: type II toxin-antitoxin system VapC family toxin [Pseudomonadota bacterium]